MKHLNYILFLLFFSCFSTFSQNLPQVKKEKTLLDFAFGMTNKEFTYHLKNLLTSHIVHNYHYDVNTDHHEFQYDFPVEDSDDKYARAIIRAKPDPYLLSIFASVSPPLDSNGTGVQKLYAAFKKHYGNPSKPLKKTRVKNGDVYSEAIWEGANYSVRWFQWDRDFEKIMLFYEAKGEYYENLKKEIDKKRGIIKVERKF